MIKAITKKYLYIVKNTNRQAFTLIEVVIYLALLLFMILIFSNFIKNVREFYSLSSKTTNNILRHNLFVDVIRRDLMGASSKNLDWNESKFVFKKFFLDESGLENIVCIGYEVRKNSLFRIEGRYDFLSSKWHKRISSLIAPDFESLNVVLKKNKDPSFANVRHSLGGGVRASADKVVSVEIEYKFIKSKEMKNIFMRLRNI